MAIRIHSSSMSQLRYFVCMITQLDLQGHLQVVKPDLFTVHQGPNQGYRYNRTMLLDTCCTLKIVEIVVLTHYEPH